MGGTMARRRANDTKKKKDAQKVIEKETEIFKVEEPKLKSKKK